MKALYLGSFDMDAAEFEALLDVALRGGQPEHPDLPLFLEMGGLPPAPESFRPTSLIV